jgi:hypothetical protein
MKASGHAASRVRSVVQLVPMRAKQRSAATPSRRMRPARMARTRSCTRSVSSGVMRCGQVVALPVRLWIAAVSGRPGHVKSERHAART